MYILKNVGDSTPPCGTPFLNRRCLDVLFLNVVYIWCGGCLFGVVYV